MRSSLFRASGVGLFIILLLAVFAGCSTIDCPVQNLVYTKYYLKKGDLTPDTLNGDTLTIFTVRRDGTDSIVLNQGTEIASYNLPISYTSPEDVFYYVMEIDSVIYVDTVWIKKDNFPHFESVDCNAAYFHKITDIRYTTHLIDSIVINNPNVNYDVNTEHFHIYFK
jgi:hypothetical protein